MLDIEIIRKRKIEGNTSEINIDLDNDVYEYLFNFSKENNIDFSQIINSILKDEILKLEEVPSGFKTAIDQAILEVKLEELIESKSNYLLINDFKDRSKDVVLLANPNSIEEINYFETLNLKHSLLADNKEIVNDCFFNEETDEIGFVYYTENNLRQWQAYDIIPSDWMFMVEKKFRDSELFPAAMIAYSKSRYRDGRKLFNKVYFNANVFLKLNGVFYKVWYGDLDLSEKCGFKLKEVASKLNTTLYVLSEMDGRFNNENNQSVLSKQVWNTNDELPLINDDDFEKNRKNLKNSKLNIKKMKKKNS